MISLDSKVLKGSDRNKASSFREAIALIYALISNEAAIKNHEAQVIVLDYHTFSDQAIIIHGSLNMPFIWGLFRICQFVIQSVRHCF